MAEHEVPFVSQQGYREAQWRRFGCGTAALKMVLDYWHRRDPRNRTAEADDLYATGLEAGAFDPAFGWRHAGLVGLARSHGYEAYNVDAAPRSRHPMTAQEALAELTRELSHGPVIASVYRDFDPGEGGGHLVVVTGDSGGALLLNDPKPAQEADGRLVMSTRDFLPAFKHRYIVVRPRHEPTTSSQPG
ncbi:MAG TPA: C39 family peptidase [Micromonosporaceae bacterium]|jgi:hypothetical protein